MKPSILLALAVWGTAAQAQVDPAAPSSLLTTYLDLGPSSAQPFAAYLEKKGPEPLKVDLSALPVTLTPVTPMSGQPATGTLGGPAAYEICPTCPSSRRSPMSEFTDRARGKARSAARRARDRYQAVQSSRVVEVRLRALEDEAQEARQLQRRVAELTDVVTELLIPIHLRDDARVEEVLERYRARL